MKLSAKLLGLQIEDGDIRYEYSYTPFTQSSKLFDEDGSLLAELKRFGWFTLNFNLETQGNDYIFKCRQLNSELITPEGDVIRTDSSVNFYHNGQRLTQLKHDLRYQKYVALEIFSETHRTALMIASCLFTIRYLHGGNYS